MLQATAATTTINFISLTFFITDVKDLPTTQNENMPLEGAVHCLEAFRNMIRSKQTNRHDCHYRCHLHGRRPPVILIA